MPTEVHSEPQELSSKNINTPDGLKISTNHVTSITDGEVPGVIQRPGRNQKAAAVLGRAKRSRSLQPRMLEVRKPLGKQLGGLPKS